MRVPARDSSATIDAQARPLSGEARYRQILQSLPAAIYTCDTEGYITFYNEAAAELWGHHPRLGRDRWCGSWKIFHPDGTPMAHEDCPMGVATRERRSVRGQEILVERPDGSRCFVLPHPDPIRDDSGVIIGTVNMLVNVDGIRGTDQALRLYKEIFAASLDGIAIIAPDGTYLEQNAAHHDLLGYSDQELQGKTPAIHFGQQTFETIGQALAREGRFRGVAASRAKSGRHLDIELSAFSVRDAQGRLLCHVGMKRDITERKRAEQALAKRANEQSVLYQFTDKLHRATCLTEVYEAALAGIMKSLECQRASILLFDDSGVMRFVAWRGLSDDYRRAVEGHSPWKAGERDPQPVCIEDISTAEIPEALKAVVQAEGIRSLAFMPLVFNGRLLGKFMAYHDGPHHFTQGELDLGLTIARQLAFGLEQKRAEDALEAAVQERTASLREAVAQMEEFSYSVSHDLRAPLRAMTSYANVLLEDYASSLDDTARMCVENIRRSSQRMDRLTQDVLTYSRVARTQVYLAKVDLDKLVRDLVHQYVDLQQAAADLHVESPLPAVRAHEASLAQCISNLLTNAIKFVPKGIRPVIRIRAEVIENDVRLWVEDNGIGIKPEFQQRLFQMFERLNPAGTFEGNGIGLAIVRKAMEKMGGRFGLESDGQSGSRFWLQLPKATA